MIGVVSTIEGYSRMRLVESGKLGPVLAGLIAEHAGNPARIIELCLVIPSIASHIREGSKLVSQTLSAWAGSAQSTDRHILTAERALNAHEEPREKFHECFTRAIFDHSAAISDEGFVTIFAQIAGSVAPFVAVEDREALFIFFEQEASQRCIHVDEKPELALKMVEPLLRLIIPDIERDPAIISQAIPTITANLRLPLEDVVTHFHSLVKPEVLERMVA